MNTDSKVNLMQQAEVALASANWSLLLHCLQQMILGENAASVSQESKVKKHSARGQETLLLTESELDQVLDLAIEVLLYGDFHQRWDIAKLFPRLGTKAIAPLIEILEDEDTEEELRWFAGRMLGEVNHPEAIAALVEVLKTSESEELSSMAAAALGNIGSAAVTSLTQLLAIESTRLLAVRSLSYIRRTETIVPLLSVVQDLQISVRAAAIEALSSFHDPRIPSVLVNALDDIAAPVRREAVNGLSFRPDLREELDLVNQLKPRLYDFNVEVCCCCAIALGRLGTDAAATALYQALISPHTPIKLQLEIVRALGWLGTAIGLEYLRSCLNQELSVTVWEEIVTVLGRVEEPLLTSLAAQMLIDLLQSDHRATDYSSVKSAIALSLGHLGDVRAIQPLIGLLATDATVRLHVIAALKQLAPETGQQQLEQLVTNDALAPQLKQGVVIALQEWSIELSTNL